MNADMITKPIPQTPDVTGSSPLLTQIRRGTSAFGDWLRSLQRSTKSQSRLKLCDTLSLGERRFVALIEMESQQFLVGGSASTVTLLATLSKAKNRRKAAKRSSHA